jgi:hypothetical protein
VRYADQRNRATDGARTNNKQSHIRTSTERRGGLMTTVAFTINGKPTSVDASGDTPLL